MLTPRIVEFSYPGIFEKELVDEIVSAGKLRRVNRGAVIIEPGEEILMMPLMLKGSLRISRVDEEGNEVFLYYIAPAETCAMSLTCCMTSRRSEIIAVAEDKSEFISIPVEYLDVWMQKYASWRNFIFRSYSIRFEGLLQTIDTIAFQKMDERLENYLRKKSEAIKSPVIQETHMNIAESLNTSREVISRLLKQLEKKGKLRLARNKIELIKE